MLREEALRLVMALGDDALDLLVDRARRLVAEGPRPRRREAIQAVEIRVLARSELHEAEALAHAPPRDHAPREHGRLLDVVLRARRLGTVHDLLGRAAAEHADDARPKVSLGIVVPIAVRSLIGDA